MIVDDHSAVSAIINSHVQQKGYELRLGKENAIEVYKDNAPVKVEGENSLMNYGHVFTQATASITKKSDGGNPKQTQKIETTAEQMKDIPKAVQQEMQRQGMI